MIKRSKMSIYSDVCLKVSHQHCLVDTIRAFAFYPAWQSEPAYAQQLLRDV